MAERQPSQPPLGHVAIRRDTACSAAEDSASDTDAAEVLGKPTTSNEEERAADENKMDGHALPFGAHVVFCGTEEADDTESCSSSSVPLNSDTSQSVSAYRSSMFEVSSTGASSNVFWPALPAMLAVSSIGASSSSLSPAPLAMLEVSRSATSSSASWPPLPAMLAVPSTGASSSASWPASFDSARGSNPIDVGARDTSQPSNKKQTRTRKRKSKPKAGERKKFNRLKEVLIEQCEENPEHFDPKNVELPDDMANRPSVANKLRARLAKLREAALMAMAGGDASMILAARAQLGYGDRNLQGRLIKLKKG